MRDDKPTEAARLDREHLLRSNLPNAERVYLQARESGMAEPVVCILDLRDVLARDLGAGLMGEEATAAAVRECAAAGEIPTAIAMMGRSDALAVLREHSDSARHALSEWVPAGYFLVVVIAAGGVLFANHREPAG